MIAPQYWQRHSELLLGDTCSWPVLALLGQNRPCKEKCEYTGGPTKIFEKLSSAIEKEDTSAAYPYVAMGFIPALAIHYLKCQQL
jgi:hypothetical protein